MTRRVAAVLCLLGCASTRPHEARRDVGELVAAAGGPDAVIPAAQDDEARAEVRRRVAELLDAPLTVDAALKIGLLNNRSLRATLEELGVAQADLVQAGLLHNPVVGGDLVFSTAGNGLGGGLSLSQSLLSAFVIPAKRRVAKARLQVAVVTVADAALRLVRDVRVAFAQMQAAVATRDLHRELVQAAEVADALAGRQQDAGNITELDRELFAAALDDARIELGQQQLAVTRAREQLNRLLGLWGEQVRWKLAGAMPEPANGSAADDLEALGVRDRLDVSAARSEVAAIEYAIKLRRRGIIPQIDGGIEARNEVGNDEGHEWVLGPSLSIEVPLFDPGHADFARLRALLRQAQHRLEQRAIVARSEIRTHQQEMLAAEDRVAYFRDNVIPRRQRVGARALERYNAMLIGAYELLDLRMQEVQARERYVAAVRDYWVARADLERAVGGRLPS